MKMDFGREDFWNIRLPLALLFGVLLFIVVDDANRRILKLILGRFDHEILIKDRKTYLPLLLVLLYPLIKSVGLGGLSYLEFVDTNIWLILLLKLILVYKLKKESSTGSEVATNGSIRSGWIGLAAAAGCVLVLLLHHITLFSDTFFSISPKGKQQSRIFNHNRTTRTVYLDSREVKQDLALPSDQSTAVMGFSITDFPNKEHEFYMPVRFSVLVTDEKGRRLAEGSEVLNAGDEVSRRWHDLDLELSGRATEAVTFRMLTTKPSLLNFLRNNLCRLLLHNPLDCRFFRGIRVQTAWSEPLVFPREKQNTDVILIVLDTLREDFLGCYGYERDISPTIDAFARENITYANAFSQANVTLPSHLSMFTGKFPNEAVVFNPFQLEPISGNSVRTKEQAIDQRTLAEILRDRGYYCAAFTDGGIVSSSLGFSKGFHHFNERPHEKGNSFKLAREWMAKNKDKASFVFIHTYLIHDYMNNDGLFKSDDVSADHAELYEWSRELFPEVDSPEGFGTRGYLSPTDLYAIRTKLVDSYLNDFFSFLREEGLYDDSMIILTSDHGESFMEAHDNGRKISKNHGGGPPYDTEIHVPLIIKMPERMRSGPLVVDKDVRLLDIAPTVLSVLGLEPDPQFRGNCILPGSMATEMGEYSFVYSISARPIGAVRENYRKYIRHEKDGKEEFYNLADDPGETNNLALLEPEEMLELRRKYSEFISDVGAKAVTLEEAVSEVPDELREEIKALGYLN